MKHYSFFTHSNKPPAPSPRSPSTVRSFFRRIFHRSTPNYSYCNRMRSTWAREEIRKRIFSLFCLALPVTPIIERRELSPARHIQQVDFDVWSEPDSKPIFTFKLRPRLIQEGNAVKLICCVTGRPMPKVISSNCKFSITNLSHLGAMV